MDNPLIYLPLIILLSAILIVFAALRNLRKKGQRGEREVSRALGKNKPDEQYIINNLMIINEGKSHQIDHLLINRTGIYVIETKDYSGQIYGAESQREWTQTLQYGKVKNRFYNPIMQNKTHIYALSNVLKRKDCFTSIVVFPRAELKITTTAAVGDIVMLQEIIRRNNKVMFTIREMNLIYSQLLEIKNNPAVSDRQHIAQIKQMKKDVANNICPRCGKALVFRSGQYGEFYGCSGFPTCKFKKQVK